MLCKEYVVHQLRTPDYERHDEDKVFLGFGSEEEAKAAYLAHRDDGEKAYGGMSSIPTETFKAKLRRRSGSCKIRHEAQMTKQIEFSALRGPDGKVRVGVWDRVCIPGRDEKDGQATEFSLDTLSQMVDNFAERGDPIPIDYNHQSNYAAQNGQPAPALGFYGALAVVWDGSVVKERGLPGITFDHPPALDGLWALRTEVTELGDELLPNFKLLSPTFTPQGVRRDGSECGYQLYAVAATNTPWQSQTQITFEAGAAGAIEPAAMVAAQKKEGRMSPEMLAKLGLAEGASPEEMAAACMKYMEAADEKMAAMAAGDPPYGGKESPEEEAAEEKLKMEKDDAEAKLATMEASLAATREQLTRLQKREDERAAAEKAERTRQFEQLADQAIAGGYPKESRAALVKFASVDFDGARASVGHFLPRSGSPSHLFDRMTAMGAPIGKAAEAREVAGPAKPKTIKSALGNFVEVDGSFAEEVRRVAESKEPITMEKVDKLIPESQRAVTFHRLLAAERIVRAERPDLAESAE